MEFNDVKHMIINDITCMNYDKKMSIVNKMPIVLIFPVAE